MNTVMCGCGCIEWIGIRKNVRAFFFEKKVQHYDFCVLYMVDAKKTCEIVQFAHKYL